MICYSCGCTLTEADTCPGCGADVSLYKDIVCLSNAFYNEGLAKAQARDLSGAITSLRESLRADKSNVNARNLLGLCLYESGEIAEALSEWVISCNLKPEGNLASAYMEDVQKNRNRLEAQSNAIKKYNLSLDYCTRGSLDLAVIQLKKVIQLNGHFVRARNLLALLYLQGGDCRRARKQLEKALEIDRGNTLSLRYLKEADAQLNSEEDNGNAAPEQEQVLRYQDGNETIIQPGGSRSPSLEMDSLPKMLINIGLGILIGAAVVGFLIMPVRVQAIRNETNDQLRAVAEQLDARTATVTEQQQTIDKLTEENTTLSAKVEEYEDSGELPQNEDALFTAAMLYIEHPDDIAALAEQFSRISDDGESAGSYNELYHYILGNIRGELAEYYYTSGRSALNDGDYDKAIQAFSDAVRYGNINVDTHYEEAVYYLAEAYYDQYLSADTMGVVRYADNLALAEKYYQQALDVNPTAEYSQDAQAKLEAVREAGAEAAADTVDAASEGDSADASSDGETVNAEQAETSSAAAQE